MCKRILLRLTRRFMAALAALFAAWCGHRPVEALDECPGCAACDAAGFEPGEVMIRITGVVGFSGEYACSPAICPPEFQGEITVSEVN